MPPAWGRTAAGFVAKPTAQILSDMQASILAAVDPQLDLSPYTPDGQILGVYANDMGAVWEVLQVADNEFNRQDAEGAALDNIGDLTGDPREGESFTQVFCTLGLDVAHAPYAPGALVANVHGQTSQTYSNLYAIQASQISGGTATGILFQSTTAGATPAVNAGTLTDITTPVTGWTSITNPAGQSQLGTNAELDPAYRVRQLEELAGQGGCTAQSLKAALVAAGAAQAPPVSLAVNVLENRSAQSATVQGVGLPPNSFAVVLYDTGGWSAPGGPGAAVIAATLYANKPPGIAMVGSTSLTVQDPILGTQTVSYTYPTTVIIDVSTTVAIVPTAVFSNVSTGIGTALAAAAIAPTPASGIPPLGQLVPGTWVVGSQLEGVIMSVPGVFEVQALTWAVHGTSLGTAAIQLTALQVATFTGGNLTIVQGTYP